MKNSFDEKILDEARDWLLNKQDVVLATVIQTWGSSPRQVGSRMIVNNKGVDVDMIFLFHVVRYCCRFCHLSCHHCVLLGLSFVSSFRSCSCIVLYCSL